jgi:hypothetical protein
LIAVIPIAAHLRMHRSEREFRPLNNGLRVRMLTGWVHGSTAYEPFTWWSMVWCLDQSLRTIAGMPREQLDAAPRA